MKDLSWEILREGENLLILACGSMVGPAARLTEALWNNFNLTATILNCRVIKPLDEKMLLALLPKFNKIVTVEENVLSGGFGSAILEYIESNQLEGISVCRLGIPDNFVTHGDRKSLLKEVGLDDESILRKIENFLSLTTDKKKLIFKPAEPVKEPARVPAQK